MFGSLHDAVINDDVYMIWCLWQWW